MDIVSKLRRWSREGRKGEDARHETLIKLRPDSDLLLLLYFKAGGAHATVWATDLSSTYAPELNVVGSASGGL